MVVLVTLTAILWLASSLSSESNLSKNISSNLENIKTIEDTFYDASLSEVRVSRILEEDFSKQIHAGITSCDSVQNYIANFDLSNIKDNDLRDSIAVTYNEALEYCPRYHKVAEAYEKFYSAYYNNNLEILTDYVKTKEELQPVAQRLEAYFSSRDYWQKELNANNCSSNDTTTCRRAELYYDENQNTFMANTSMARLIFTYDISQPYKQDTLFYKRLEKLIGELNA